MYTVFTNVGRVKPHLPTKRTAQSDHERAAYMKRPRDPDHLLKLGEIIIIQDNRPDITITVSEGASMIMVGLPPLHAALCQHTQNTSATLVSIAMLLVFSVYHLTYWGINLWDYDYHNQYFLISMNGCCCFVTSSSTITNWIIGLWNKYLPSWAINLWNVPWKVIHGMKIHVLLLPDPEEYLFSIYIKFVNEKFCVFKNKLASFWWRHRHWTIAWENWLLTRDHLEDKKPSFNNNKF